MALFNDHVTLVNDHVALMYDYMTLIDNHVTLVNEHMTLVTDHVTLLHNYMTMVSNLMMALQEETEEEVPGELSRGQKRKVASRGGSRSRPSQKKVKTPKARQLITTYLLLAIV